MDQEYDKLVDVALRYFRYGDSQPFIAESLKTSQSNISKWLSKAEELGIVTHVIDANAAVVADQDRRLSSNLSQAFGLQCDVLDCRSVASSDKLHIALANFAGEKSQDSNSIERAHRNRRGTGYGAVVPGGGTGACRKIRESTSHHLLED